MNTTIAQNEDGPWVLMCHDPFADDHGGDSRAVGFFRTRAAAQAKADAENAGTLAEFNRRVRRGHESSLRAWAEYEALVAAGLRPPRANGTPPTLEPFTSLDDVKSAHLTYSVEPIEFEDDDQ